MAAARTPAPVQYSKVDGWSSAGGGLAEVVMCSGNPGFNTSYVYFASPAVDVDGAEQAYSSKDVTKIGQVFTVNGNNFGLDSPVSAAVEYDRDSKTFAGWSENCVVIKQPPLGKTKRNTVYGDPEVDEQGFCISKTSWEDKTFKVTDRARYVDAMRIPYFVLPPDMPVYTEIGACGFFVSTLGGQCGAVYADAGNSGEIGEISWNLAKRLLLPGDARLVGWRRKKGVPKDPQSSLPLDLFGVAFPGSAGAKPGNHAGGSVDLRGRSVFTQWGGFATLQAAVNQMSAKAQQAFRTALQQGAGAGHLTEPSIEVGIPVAR